MVTCIICVFNAELHFVAVHHNLCLLAFSFDIRMRGSARRTARASVQLQHHENLAALTSQNDNNKKQKNVHFTSRHTRRFSPAGSSDAHTQTGPGEVATPTATREWQC